MTLCTDKLVQVLQTTQDLKEDLIDGAIAIGDVATKAWGTGLKATCYQEMPPHEIYNFIVNYTGDVMQGTTTNTGVST